MKTKLCKPILIPTDEPSFLVKGQILASVGMTDIPNDNSVCKQQLILISLDPDEKIEVGDNIIKVNPDKKVIGNMFTATQCEVLTQSHKGFTKVIATQNQLPESYIQQFIEEYNGDEVKDIEIEMEEITEPVLDGNWRKYTQHEPKLTNGFVTIVKKELPNINFKDATLQDLYDRGFPKVGNILYTEEEVEDLCSRAWIQAYRKLNYPEIQSGFLKWFSENKKK